MHHLSIHFNEYIHFQAVCSVMRTESFLSVLQEFTVSWERQPYKPHLIILLNLFSVSSIFCGSTRFTGHRLWNFKSETSEKSSSLSHSFYWWLKGSFYWSGTFSLLNDYARLQFSLAQLIFLSFCKPPKWCYVGETLITFSWKQAWGRSRSWGPGIIMPYLAVLSWEYKVQFWGSNSGAHTG